MRSGRQRLITPLTQAIGVETIVTTDVDQPEMLDLQLPNFPGDIERGFIGGHRDAVVETWN